MQPSPSCRNIEAIDGLPVEANYKYLSGKLTIPARIEDSGKTYTVTEIAHAALSYSSGLTSITVPACVRKIGWAFSDCLRVKEFILEDGPLPLEMEHTDIIGDMENLHSIYLGRNLSGMTHDVFAYYEFVDGQTSSYGLVERIEFGDYVNQDGAPKIWHLPNLTELKLGSGFTAIPDYFTQGLAQLKSLSIPGSVLTVGEGAFNKLAPRTVRFEDSENELKFLGYQYWNLSGLQDVYLGRNLGPIPGAIAKFEAVKKIEIGDMVTNLAYLQNMQIESLTLGANVRRIEENAFSGCSELRTVKLNDRLEYIGSGAFGGTLIEEIALPASLTYLGSDAFNLSGLKRMDINGNDLVIEWLNSEDFMKGEQLVIPACVKSFRGELPGVSSLVIEDSDRLLEGVPYVKGATSAYVGREFIDRDQYGNRVTLGSENFKSVEIGGKVRSVIPEAFMYCKELETLTLNEGVETIGHYAFYDTRTLKTIKFPSTLKRIDGEAFWFTNVNLTIYCSATVPPAGIADSMDIVSQSRSTVYVPYGFADTYRQSEWRNFDIKEYDVAVDEISAEEGGVQPIYFTPDGLELPSAPESGLYIKVSDGKSQKIIAR